MERIIKFRAKRIDTGDWVFGEYFRTPLTDENSNAKVEDGLFFLSGVERHCIRTWTGSVCVIDPATLGQFTGKLDKNQKEIYERDIVTCGERVGIGRMLRSTRGEVHYVGSSACFCIQIPWIEYGDKDDGSKVSWEFGHFADFEIVGNTIDSPELLN